MPETTAEQVQSQMRKGTLEYGILLIIARGQVYASEILSELKEANLLVVEGTLYPLLSRLKTAGYLEYTWAESTSGPPRKYYTLTKAGRSNLALLHLNWKTLSSSIERLAKPYEKNS
jgi:PadR family transcriptional regulator PadR